jgi:hypothetical protein
VGREGFACGVPAAVERVASGLLTCSFMGRPPVAELLVPALGLAGAADTQGGSPYGGLYVGVHHDLLGYCGVPIASTNRLLTNIGCNN